MSRDLGRRGVLPRDRLPVAEAPAVRGAAPARHDRLVGGRSGLGRHVLAIIASADAISDGRDTAREREPADDAPGDRRERPEREHGASAERAEEQAADHVGHEGREAVRGHLEQALPGRLEVRRQHDRDREHDADGHAGEPEAGQHAARDDELRRGQDRPAPEADGVQDGRRREQAAQPDPADDPPDAHHRRDLRDRRQAGGEPHVRRRAAELDDAEPEERVGGHEGDVHEGDRDEDEDEPGSDPQRDAGRSESPGPRRVVGGLRRRFRRASSRPPIDGARPGRPVPRRGSRRPPPPG